MNKLKLILCLLGSSLIISSCGQSVIEVVNSNFVKPVKDERFFSTSIWQSKTENKDIRREMAFVQVGDNIYSIGGDRNAQWLPTNEVYNIKTDSWQMKTPLSSNRSGLGASAIDKKIYVFGGFDGLKGTWLSTLEVYNTESDTWEKKSNMSLERSSIGVVNLNNKIYVAGGILSKSQWTDTFEEYSPEIDTWKKLESMQTPRAQVAMATTNNKIYVLGGENQNGVLDDVEEYTLKTSKWKKKTSLPTPRANARAIAYKSNIIVMGGRNKEGKLLDSIDIYNIDTDKWITGKPLSEPKEGFGVLLSNDNSTVYTFGGLTSQGISGKLETSTIEQINP